MLRRRLLIWLTLIGTPILLVSVIAIGWGWALLIPLIQSRASAALGRPVTVGQLHLSPGRISRITVDDVVIGNPPGWEGEPFVKVPRLVVDVDAWSYLRHRELVVPLVLLEEPTLLATQNQAGAANYQLQLAGGSVSSARLGEVQINNGRAFVRLARLKADFMLGIATRTNDGESKLEVDARGTYAAQPITGRLVGGGLLSLRYPNHPWPVDLRLKNGPTEVTLVGTIADPLTLSGASLKLRFAGPDMSLLEKLVGLPIPKTPNYQVTGELDFANNRVRFKNLSGRLGNSDISGTIEVDPTRERPDVVAKLASRRVDLADLGGFIGSTPGRIGTTGQTPAERAEVAKAEASPRLLPDTPISVPKLHWADIHLEYTGQRIEGRSMPLDQLIVTLDIVDGKVTLHPIRFTIGSGRISAKYRSLSTSSSSRSSG